MLSLQWKTPVILGVLSPDPGSDRNTIYVTKRFNQFSYLLSYLLFYLLFIILLIKIII